MNVNVSVEDRDALAAHFGADNDALQAALQRRDHGEPLAYILGYFDFMETRFHADPRAYVTDPEAECLVHAVIREIDAFRASCDRWPVVAEAGIGGGALGITVKLARPEITLIGVDIDPDALAVGAENINRTGVEIELVESDWFASWPRSEPPDLVFADPPWGRESDLYDESRDARHYHAMPSGSTFPADGPMGAHRALMQDVRSRGWASHLVLNVGVLSDEETVDSTKSAARARLVRSADGIGLVHVWMHAPSFPVWHPGKLAATNQAAWNELYASTSDLVWGKDPVGFLEAFLAPEDFGGLKRKRVLDAGCGEGRNLTLLRRHAETLTACDASDEALAKIPAAWREGVDIHKCHLDDTPFADASFDLILLCDTVETLPDAQSVLCEMRRIVAPDGFLVCNIPGPEGDVAGTDMSEIGPDQYLYRSRFFFQFLQGDESRQLLSSAGWRIERDELMSWVEPAHPEFRPEPHHHRSHVYLLKAALTDATGDY